MRDRPQRAEPVVLSSRVLKYGSVWRSTPPSQSASEGRLHSPGRRLCHRLRGETSPGRDHRAPGLQMATSTPDRRCTCAGVSRMPGVSRYSARMRSNACRYSAVSTVHPWALCADLTHRVARARSTRRWDRRVQDCPRNHRTPARGGRTCTLDGTRAGRAGTGRESQSRERRISDRVPRASHAAELNPGTVGRSWSTTSALWTHHGQRDLQRAALRAAWPDPFIRRNARDQLAACTFARLPAT